MDIIGGITSFLVHSALDALSQRHNVISNNIANANTPGFSPQKLEFEHHLQRFLSISKHADAEGKMIKYFNQFESDLLNGRMIKMTKEDVVELDIEMARLTDNLLRYQALLEGMSKRTAVLKMAINDGRG